MKFSLPERGSNRFVTRLRPSRGEYQNSFTTGCALPLPKLPGGSVVTSREPVASRFSIVCCPSASCFTEYPGPGGVAHPHNSRPPIPFGSADIGGLAYVLR